MVRDRKRKILIVDDEEGVREVLAEWLRPRGYEIKTAVDGQDGLAKALQFLPDLILLDVVMPNMDGWQMLKELKSNEKTQDAHVIMLTAKSETEALMKSQKNEVEDYFIKPINLQELLTYIRRYI